MTGLTTAAFSNIKYGHSLDIRPETAHKLEVATGFNAEWIRTGTGPRYARDRVIQPQSHRVMTAKGIEIAWRFSGLAPVCQTKLESHLMAYEAETIERLEKGLD